MKKKAVKIRLPTPKLPRVQPAQLTQKSCRSTKKHLYARAYSKLYDFQSVIT